MLENQLAEYWVRRWDVQQQGYVTDREERFTVIGDVLARVVGDRPMIVDLGCGPGSLSARLGQRWPEATVIGVDSDPLLLELGRAHYDGIRFVEADLADSAWVERAQLPDVIDAAVSTTALHWMAREDLARLYGTLAAFLRPGGAFVNADHLPSGAPVLDKLILGVRQDRASRRGVDVEDSWQDWWDAVLDDPRLSSLLDERSDRASGHHTSNQLSPEEHADLLRAAGFSEVGTVWQSGDDRVLVAVR